MKRYSGRRNLPVSGISVYYSILHFGNLAIRQALLKNYFSSVSYFFVWYLFCLGHYASGFETKKAVCQFPFNIAVMFLVLKYVRLSSLLCAKQSHVYKVLSLLLSPMHAF